MKKETLIEIILGTVGGLVFAFGMCMCLIPEWNMFTAGVIIAIIGAVILFAIIPVHKKSHPKKQHKAIDIKLLITWIIGVFGALLMGFGMSKILVEGASQFEFIRGIVAGVIGLLICALNYPVYAYIKNKED